MENAFIFWKYINCFDRKYPLFIYLLCMESELNLEVTDVRKIIEIKIVLSVDESVDYAREFILLPSFLLRIL